jgi:hypothetical protein
MSPASTTWQLRCSSDAATTVMMLARMIEKMALWPIRFRSLTRFSVNRTAPIVTSDEFTDPLIETVT